MSEGAERGRVVVSGVVTALTRDDEGRPLSMGLSARDEKEYRVEPSGAGAELRELERAFVEIEGHVNRKGLLVVRAWRVIHGPLSPERS